MKKCQAEASNCLVLWICWVCDKF